MSELSWMKKYERRMKYFEKNHETLLSGSKPYIIRLDGHNFSTFMKDKDKFETKFVEAMIRTTKEIMKRTSNIIYGYTQSDEITLVFDSSKEPDFKGRIMKITTILAGLCTAIFNKEYPNDKTPHFDARIFEVDTEDDIYNNILWRMRDGIRNSKAKKNSELEWNQMDNYFRFGTLIKKIMVDKSGYNPITKSNVIVQRSTLLEISDYFPSIIELKRFLLE